MDFHKTLALVSVVGLDLKVVGLDLYSVCDRS